MHIHIHERFINSMKFNWIHICRPFLSIRNRSHNKYEHTREFSWLMTSNPVQIHMGSKIAGEFGMSLFSLGC